MSQNNSNEKNEKSRIIAKIEEINRIDGFDPSVFAIDFTDIGSGEKRKRLLVITQIAWFRMKYPEGKLAIQVSKENDFVVATARIYPNYKDAPDAYLAEATASCVYCSEKPSLSPLELAQTAALSVALQNAGFGLQFQISGEDLGSTVPNELGPNNSVKLPAKTGDGIPEVTPPAIPDEDKPVQRELTQEEKIQKAMLYPCPITKHKGKTLGDVLKSDPGAVNWVATKFTGDQEIMNAAKMICEYALNQAAASA